MVPGTEWGGTEWGNRTTVTTALKCPVRHPGGELSPWVAEDTWDNGGGAGGLDAEQGV